MRPVFLREGRGIVVHLGMRTLRRVLPLGLRALGEDIALRLRHARITVREPGADLPLAIDVEFRELQFPLVGRRHLADQDSVLVRLPIAVEPHPAANNHRAFLDGLIGDRRFSCPRILGAENQRPADVICPRLQPDGDGFLTLDRQPPDEHLCFLQGRQRLLLRSGIRVPSVRCHVNFGAHNGTGNPRARRQDGQRETVPSPSSPQFHNNIQSALLCGPAGVRP
jgi:hypothetical protein